jgi:hypothetical protein
MSVYQKKKGSLYALFTLPLIRPENFVPFHSTPFYYIAVIQFYRSTLHETINPLCILLQLSLPIGKAYKVYQILFFFKKKQLKVNGYNKVTVFFFFFYLLEPHLAGSFLVVPSILSQ